MSDLTPEFCPHCLANFREEMVEIKTSAPPKCGRCSLPLWWEDRSGKELDKPWPSYLEICRLRAAASGFRASVLRLLTEGRGPGGGYYRPDQRLDAATTLLEIGWGKETE